MLKDLRLKKRTFFAPFLRKLEEVRFSRLVGGTAKEEDVLMSPGSGSPQRC